MVVRRIKIVICFLLCFLLQGNVAHYFSIAGGVPDFLLVMILNYTFLDDSGSYDGLIAGTVSGFFRDICYGQIVGTTSLLFLLIGGLMFYMRRRLNTESKIILFFVTALSTAVFILGQWVLYVLFTQSWQSFFREVVSIPGALFWNFVLLLVISLLMDRRRRRSRFGL